jgi:hopene-associated glycosyltransferase HpnB
MIGSFTETPLIFLGALSTLSWVGFALCWDLWRASEVLDAVKEAAADEDLGDLTVLIPARNEAEAIQRTLRSLGLQGRNLTVVIVDDRSQDDTVAKARQTAIANLRIIEAAPLPPGWSGKLWALEQGRREITTPQTLLLDADIELAPATIGALKEKMHKEQIPFISLMAMPSMSTSWEKLLMPGFVYFFNVLYSFPRVNSLASRVAGAAGGCILLETRLLDQIGAFDSIRSAVIDDCTLARQIKSRGVKIWLGLTHSAKSIRGYKGLTEIWDMVARAAFAQLQYSTPLLLLCTALMGIVYGVPVVLLGSSHDMARSLALTSLAIMALTYAPTLRFYGRSVGWALCLPFVAGLFLVMTWSSAIRYWRGERTRWKGRVYQRQS